jgi:hypothetical protein
MENPESKPMSFFKALSRFIFASLLFLSFIYLSYFGLVARKANLFADKQCEIEIFAGATVPLDADIPTESCSRPIWKNGIIWGIFVFFLSIFVWIAFDLLGALMWKHYYSRYFRQHRTASIAFIFFFSLLPSTITFVLLVYNFTFAKA